MKMLIPIFFLLSLSANASFTDAARIYSTGDKNKYPQLVSELMEEGMYFSAALSTKNIWQVLDV